MYNEDYITYEQAIEVKKAGYECSINDDLRESDEHGMIPHFTLAQAAKWIREVKKLDIDVHSDFQKDAIAQVGKRIYFYELWDNFKPAQLACSFSTPSDTYEEALSAGISKALEIINDKQNRL